MVLAYGGLLAGRDRKLWAVEREIDDLGGGGGGGRYEQLGVIWIGLC